MKPGDPNRDAGSSHGQPKESLDLKGNWTFWYLIRHGRASVQAANYEHALHQIATATTAEDFWAIYGHLKRPSTLPSNSDYQVFREGVKPVWEDPSNERGGKWVIRIRKDLADRLWEHLLLALMAGALDSCKVCGVVLSVRYAEDILSVWSSDASDEEAKQSLKEALRAVLCLPPTFNPEYKAHDTAMKDSSSFRNMDKVE